MGLGNNIMQSSLFLTSPAYNITRFANESCMLSVLLATFDALFSFWFAFAKFMTFCLFTGLNNFLGSCLHSFSNFWCNDFPFVNSALGCRALLQPRDCKHCSSYPCREVLQVPSNPAPAGSVEPCSIVPLTEPCSNQAIVEHCSDHPGWALLREPSQSTFLYQQNINSILECYFKEISNIKH